MTKEFDFQPTKTYASAENARKAVSKFSEADFRFTIVGVPGTNRFTPVFFGEYSVSRAAAIAFNGWTVVG